MSMLAAMRTSMSMVGVDIGTRWVKAAQLRRVGRSWRLHAAAKIERPLPDRVSLASGPPAWTADEAMRLGDVLERSGFHPAGLNVAAPREMLLATTLELPARSSGAPIEQIARAELARSGKCDAASMEMAMWDLPAAARSQAGTPVMAVALPSDRGEQIAAAFDSGAWEVHAIDFRPVGLARAVRPWLGNGVGVVLEFGWDATLISLISAERVVFQRSLEDLGLGRLHGQMVLRTGLAVADIDAALNPPDTEACGHRASSILMSCRALIADHMERLGTELSRSLGYAQHRHANTAVTGLCLVGDGGLISGVRERLSAAAGLEARVVTPESVAICKSIPARLAGDPAMAAAVGLAMNMAGESANDAMSGGGVS